MPHRCTSARGVPAQSTLHLSHHCSLTSRTAPTAAAGVHSAVLTRSRRAQAAQRAVSLHRASGRLPGNRTRLPVALSGCATPRGMQHGARYATSHAAADTHPPPPQQVLKQSAARRAPAPATAEGLPIAAHQSQQSRELSRACGGAAVRTGTGYRRATTCSTCARATASRSPRRVRPNWRPPARPPLHPRRSPAQRPSLLSGEGRRRTGCHRPMNRGGRCPRVP